MPEDKLDHEPENKIYSPFAIQLATFFGGPIVAGYLIAENFKLLGEPEKVRLTWLHTIIASCLIFTAMFVIPGLKDIPPFIFPVIYSLVASYLVRRYQGERIKVHIENNGQFYSIWRAILVCVIVVLIMVILIVILVVLSGDKDLLQKLSK